MRMNMFLYQYCVRERARELREEQPQMRIVLWTSEFL